jgi:hypothetical protein
MGKWKNYLSWVNFQKVTMVELKFTIDDTIDVIIFNYGK